MYLDADDEGDVMQTMPLQDFIAQLEQAREQHQHSAQSIEQRLARLREFQRVMGPRYEVRVAERAPSLHEWAYEVLKEAGQPLHVVSFFKSDIIMKNGDSERTSISHSYVAVNC